MVVSGGGFAAREGLPPRRPGTGCLCFTAHRGIAEERAQTGDNRWTPRPGGGKPLRHIPGAVPPGPAPRRSEGPQIAHGHQISMT